MSKANLGKKKHPEKGCAIFSYLWCNIYEPMIAIHIVKNSEGNYRSVTKLRTKVELNKKNKTITHKIFTPKVRDNYFLCGLKSVQWQRRQIHKQIFSNVKWYRNIYIGKIRYNENSIAENFHLLVTNVYYFLVPSSRK